jgi:hypothetical protein
MSYRQPPYVPANKDLAGRGEQHNKLYIFSPRVKKESLFNSFEEEYFPSDTEILGALREICSGPLWIEKNDIETVRKLSFVIRTVILRCERDF